MNKNRLIAGTAFFAGIVITTTYVMFTISYAHTRLLSNSGVEMAWAWFLWIISGIIVSRGASEIIRDELKDRGYDI